VSFLAMVFWDWTKKMQMGNRVCNQYGQRLRSSVDVMYRRVWQRRMDSGQLLFLDSNNCSIFGLFLWCAIL